MAGRSLWSSVFLSLGVVAVPTYFKFVLASNSLTGASVLLICYLSARNRFSSKPLPLCNANAHIFGMQAMLRKPYQLTWLETPRDVRVLSYNIFLRPPFVRNNLDDFKNERLKEFINHIDKYDIISLQEVRTRNYSQCTSLPLPATFITVTWHRYFALQIVGNNYCWVQHMIGDSSTLRNPRNRPGFLASLLMLVGSLVIISKLMLPRIVDSVKVSNSRK